MDVNNILRGYDASDLLIYVSFGTRDYLRLVNFKTLLPSTKLADSAVDFMDLCKVIKGPSQLV